MKRVFCPAIRCSLQIGAVFSLMPVELFVTKELYENYNSFTSVSVVEALLSRSEDFVVLHVVRAFVPDLRVCRSTGVIARVLHLVLACLLSAT